MWFLIGCSLFLTIPTYAQSVITWDPEQRLSFDSTAAYSPHIQAVGDTIFVAWGKPNLAQLVLRRSTDGGATWGLPRSLLPDTILNTAVSDEFVAANDLAYVVWDACDTCDTHHPGVWLRRSSDAGTTFDEPRRAIIGSISSHPTARDSSLVFTHRDRSGAKDLAVSTDSGANWQFKPIEDRGFQRLTLVGSVMHLIQSSSGTPQAEISYRRTTDLGTTWSPELILSTIDDYSSSPSDAAIAGVANGALFVVWIDAKYGGTNWFVGSVLLRRSIDNGVGWEDEVLQTDVPSGTLPSVSACDRFVGVVWGNESQPFTGISLRVSTDSGQSWLPHIAVSDSTIQAGDPDVVIIRDKIFVVWADGRTGMSQIYLRQGTFTIAGVQESGPRGLNQLHLYPGYPNPFNSTTTITYYLPDAAFVSITLYDILGREIKSLLGKQQEPGLHRVRLDASGLASGVYLIRLQAGDAVASRTVIYMK